MSVSLADTGIDPNDTGFQLALPDGTVDTPDGSMGGSWPGYSPTDIPSGVPVGYTTVPNMGAVPTFPGQGGIQIGGFTLPSVSFSTGPRGTSVGVGPTAASGPGGAQAGGPGPVVSGTGFASSGLLLLLVAVAVLYVLFRR